jgi:hypothetical protein
MVASSSMVAGARFAQYYTVPTTYWVDLVRDPDTSKLWL